MPLCGKSMKGSRQIFRCVDQVCIGAEQIQRQGKIDIIVAQSEQMRYGVGYLLNNLINYSLSLLTTRYLNY